MNIIAFILEIIILILMIFISFIKKDKAYYLVTGTVGIMMLLTIIEITAKKSFGLFYDSFYFIFGIAVPIIVIALEKTKYKLSYLAMKLKVKMYKGNKRKYYEDYVLKYPKDLLGHIELARFYKEQGEYEKAENEYIHALGITPNDHELYYEIGEVFSKCGKVEDTIQAFKKATEIKPDFLEASIALGEVLYEQEMYKEALNIYEDAIKYNPSSYDLYYNMAMTYTRLNDFKLAKNYYKKAAIINSYNDISNLNLGQIEMLFKEYKKAEEYFYSVINSKDELLSSNAYFYLAKIKVIENDKNQAITYLNLALELNPNIIKEIEQEPEFLKILGKLKLVREKELNTKCDKKIQKNISYLNKTCNLMEKLRDDYDTEINPDINKNIEKEKEV